MKTSYLKYVSPKVIFLLACIYVIATNLNTLFQFSRISIFSKKTDIAIEPGAEFSDFKELLSGVAAAGFLTNKDMTPEGNDGQFLGAQYTLAPTFLDLNNEGYQLLVLDGTSLQASLKKMQKIKARPLLINIHNKVLAQKTP